MPTAKFKRAEPDPTLLELGQMLKKYRKRKGLDQQEVAEKLGRNQATVHNWETGLTCPSFVDVLAYCQLVDLDLWPTPAGGRF